MKSYREIADNVFARRDQYVIAQRKKKQAITRATASVGSVALVSLAGFALYKNGGFREKLPVTDGAPTTTATKPTEEKILITADEPDDYISGNDGSLIPYRRNGEKFISPALQAKMKLYEDADVVYAVIVTIFLYVEDYDAFWESSEELSSFLKEFNNVHDAFYNEAKRLNPSWRGTNINDIKIWTDEMRTNYEYWLNLCDEREKLVQKYESSYIEGIKKDRLALLTNLSETAPIRNSLNSTMGESSIGYYVELSASSINILTENGGYTFSLALSSGIDSAGWNSMYND